MPDHLFIATSTNGKAVRLTETIWRKIQEHHAEFRDEVGYLTSIQATVERPEYVVTGWGGARIALAWCERAPATPKYLAVVYRELNGEGFIIAAFFISRFQRLLKRGVLWQRT